MRSRRSSRTRPLLLLAIVAAFGIAFVVNAPPKVRSVPGAAPAAARPMLVKIHAQWCPVCLLSKTTWKKLESTYGDRADLVVFDFTTRSTAAASGAEAKRLGLEQLFQEHSREFGTVLVLERGSRRLLSSIPGLSAWPLFSTAIEEALQSPSSEIQYQKADL